MKHCILTLTLILGLCLPASAAEQKKLRMVYVEWDCATASTYLAKAILEDRLGYTVETISTSLPLVWPALASKDADVTMSLWLPESNAPEYAKVKDKTELLGTLTSGARIGLVVPDYVTLKSIEDLRTSADKFKGTIIGIDPGSVAVNLTEKVINDYNIPMEITEGSGATMTAMLANAIRKQEWIVVTGWSPHWMFGRWKLHYLDDPKNIYGREETIHILGRAGLQKDHPEAWKLLKNMHYADVTQFQEYMNWNQEDGMTPEKGAQRFIKTYPDLVESWLKTE